MACLSEIQSKYGELLSSYLNLKPVLRNLYIRNGHCYPDGILNEIRAINDHLARCFRDGITDRMVCEQIYKADGHMKRLIFDCFKQLNIIFVEFTQQYEEKYFASHWITLKAGCFWRNYADDKQKIMGIIESGKMLESIDSSKAINEYQDAYVLEEQVYELLIHNRAELQLNFWQRFINALNTNKGWLWSTVVLAVVPAFIWEVIIHWTLMVEWVHALLMSL